MPFPTDERDARLLFNSHEPLGPVRFSLLMERFGSAVEALQAPVKEWECLEGFLGKSTEFRRALEKSVPWVAEEKKRADNQKIRILCSLDSEYPDGFRPLRDAPPVVYVSGALSPVDSLGVAVVGTRRPTPYGVSVAERLSREFTKAGVTVVSGLARGVDGVAHNAVLVAGGRTVAILGSGLSRLYPPEHRTLAEKISAKGAVISEFPLTAGPDASHFPRRNRLIAALSVGVVVVEAEEQSGALITARLAAEQGRDVFAVPGSIFSPMSRGPHLLIKQGVKAVDCAADVLDDIGVFQDLLRSGLSRSKVRGQKKELNPLLSPDARKVLDALSLDPTGLNDLARRSGLSVAQTSAGLLSLELCDWARALPGQRFVRSESSLER